MNSLAETLGWELRERLSGVPKAPIAWDIIDSHEHLRECECVGDLDEFPPAIEAPKGISELFTGSRRSSRAT